MAQSALESPVFQLLLDKASRAYRVDVRYAEQILLAARTAQLKRDAFSRSRQKKLDACPLAMVDLEATG